VLHQVKSPDVIQKLHTDFTPEYYQERSFLRVSVTTNLKLVELLFTRKWFCCG